MDTLASVEVDRPGPGEDLNTGAPSEPRQAATAIVLRDSEGGPEVLLVERNPDSRFMGGAWVFPGGAVHPDDADHAATAVRELEEEAGVTIPSDALVPLSRWITPAQVKIRFDTVFFVAEAPPDAEPRVDNAECVDFRWIAPEDALRASERDELLLVFPTIKHLEALTAFGSVREVLEAAREGEVRAVEPRVVVNEEGGRILLPGEPGFEN